MKLVEILAREVSKWDFGESVIYQRADGCLRARNDDFSYFGFASIAEDREVARVTRAQWEAERARIAIQERYSQDGIEAATQSNPEIEAHIADLTAIACGKRSKEDQEMWDRVAQDIHRDIVKALAQHAANGGDVNDSAKFDSATDAFDFADAFMAERAKRMKG